ncbi:GNAT family N-acetyltransferase, partial [Staphylococcus cohnii]
AKRLGFKYEGLFKHHTIYKQRSRDTYWLAMLADEWSLYKSKFENWLNENNFDEFGNQINKLSL